MTKILRWESKSNGFLKGSTFNLYSDDDLFATISDFSFKKPSIINGQKFLVKSNFSITTYPVRHLLIDFDTNKTVCEIQYHYSDNKVLIVFPDKSSYDFTPGPDNPEQTNGQVVQSYGDKLWFADSGKLEIRTNRNIEALIACFYFVQYMHHSAY